MVLARIEFKPGEGKHFCSGATQDVIEMSFESVEALVSTIRDFQKHIFNCTAQVNGKIIDLRNVSGLDASI